MGPDLTQCRLGQGIRNQVASWSVQPTWTENCGLCPFGEGKLGPYLTQCGLDQGPQ